MPKDKGVKKLRGLRVSEVSPVTEPACPGAEIIITKAKGMDGGGFKACSDCPDEGACGAKGRCAIETPAKGGRSREDRKMVRKGLEAAEAAAEAIIEKSEGEIPDEGVPYVEVARAAIEGGIEKAAVTFEELYNGVEDLEKLRRGVGALNQSVWSILDDPDARGQAPSLIAKTVMQFGSWIEDEFDVSAVAKGDDGEHDEDPDAGGSGGSAGETGIDKSGDDEMDEIAALIAKAKAAEAENEVLKGRLAKLEENETERQVDRAVDVAKAAAAIMTLPAGELRTVVKQLDEEGRKALGAVLTAAGRQAATASLFTTIGKSGDGGDGTPLAAGLVERAKARAAEVAKARGRAA